MGIGLVDLCEHRPCLTRAGSLPRTGEHAETESGRRLDVDQAQVQTLASDRSSDLISPRMLTLHPLVLLFVLSGTLMISKTLHIPKP